MRWMRASPFVPGSEPRRAARSAEPHARAGRHGDTAVGGQAQVRTALALVEGDGGELRAGRQVQHPDAVRTRHRGRDEPAGELDRSRGGARPRQGNEPGGRVQHERAERPVVLQARLDEQRAVAVDIDGHRLPLIARRQRAHHADRPERGPGVHAPLAPSRRCDPRSPRSAPPAPRRRRAGARPARTTNSCPSRAAPAPACRPAAGPPRASCARCSSGAGRPRPAPPGPRRPRSNRRRRRSSTPPPKAPTERRTTGPPQPVGTC